MNESTVQVQFETRASSWLRDEPITGETFRTPKPYNRIIAMKLGEICLELPSPAFDEPNAAGGHTSVVLPTKLAISLLGYGQELRDPESIRCKGNCHDFTTWMLGRRCRSRVEATHTMNRCAQDADSLPPNITAADVKVGEGLMVGHPDHPLQPPPHMPYAPEYGPPPLGFGGPLRILHSGVSIGAGLVLHRIALEGPLSVDPCDKFVPIQSEIPPKIPDDHWPNGRPAADDLRVLRISGLSDTKNFYP